MDDASMVRAPVELGAPQVRLNGPVDDYMLRFFIDGLALVENGGGDGPLVLELTTTGGDADVGRRIAADVRLFRERTGRRTLFLGKSVVYSAGVTIMSAFPRTERWLSRGTALLIHCRQLNKTVTFEGPLKAARMRAEALLGEIDTGLDIEEQDFEDLIEGADVGMSELLERAQVNWYVHADEAAARRLVAGLI